MAAPRPLLSGLTWEKDFLVLAGGDHTHIFLQNIWILIKMNTIFFHCQKRGGKKLQAGKVDKN